MAFPVQIASQALPMILPPAAVELSPGRHEIWLGIEGSVDGFRFQHGSHGWLTVGKRVRSVEDSLTAALALALAAVPAAKRAKLLSTLASAASKADVGELAHGAAAGKIRRALTKRTGLAWDATPTWKPKL